MKRNYKDFRLMKENVKKFRKNGYIIFKNFLNKNEVKKTLKIIDNISNKEKKSLTLWSPHYHNKFLILQYHFPTRDHHP